jgi:N4-gp56 family major capsid protein
MANETTSSLLSELLPQIVAEAMFVASERSIMRGLVKNYSLGTGNGKTVTVPIYPLQTASTLTEGDEISNVAVNTSSATLTVTTAAIRTLVTDLAVASASSSVVADIGRLFGEAIARKIDQDLTAQFGSFSAGFGDRTGAITAASIFQAVAKLKAAAVPTEGMVCVLHPEIAYDLKAALTTGGNNPFVAGGGTSEVANEAMRSGYVGQLAGIPIYETSNIAFTTNAGDFNGAVFNRDALGLAMIGDITIETERRASFLGTDIVGACHYGAGIIQNNYGRYLAFDSSINP